MPQIPDQVSCDGCGRVGTPGELATGWSLSTPPRPTGSASGADAGRQPISVLCPPCARRCLRDLEARLDP